MHTLCNVLERSHRLVARLPLGEARIREREERDVRSESLHHACAEETSRLVQRDHGGELSVHAHPSKREKPLLFERRVEAQQSCVFVGLLAQIDELSARQDLRANAGRQVIDGRVCARSENLRSVGTHALTQHLMSRIVAEERELGAAVHLCERFAKRNDGRVQIGRCRERMGERREGARGHEGGLSRRAEGCAEREC